jgi:hypothetical protein
MQVKWLFEKDVFQENLEPMIGAVKAQGMEYKIVDYIPFGGTKEFGYNPTSDAEPIVFYGSLNMAKALQRATPWIPGAYCDFEAFKCTRYYPKLGGYLLNSNYIMFPFGDMSRLRKYLCSTLGHIFFVRPNSGDKCFSGQVIKSDSFEHSVEQMGLYGTEPNELVVASVVQDILLEWRVVIVDGKAIASSLYKQKGKLEVSEGAPPNVLAYAEEIARVYSPERAFTVDVGMINCFDDTYFAVNQTLKLIELNSFSCSGLYDCNKADVVSAVSKAAIADWSEIYQGDS